ncbi:MAG TPA: hypothetical protein VNO21_20300, partial [Polyangiaceae bacterium]|nr:hypothetical protein [Polyangiaceae bacterium]
AQLEREIAVIAQAGSHADLADMVHARVRSVFSTPDVALEGVRSLKSITDVIVRALGRGP